MAERALRGTRLGATSYENDRNTDLAPRQEVAFDCPKGHRFTVPFAAEAEIPVNWECRICGATAITAAGDLPEPKKVKPPRSLAAPGSRRAASAVSVRSAQLLRCAASAARGTSPRRPTG